MEKTINQLEGCMKEIEISLTNNEIQPYIEKKYFEIQPKIDLKGFRKGKVPRNVVKQFYGKQIEFEALEDASNEEFKKIVTAEKIKVVGQAALKDIKDIENGKTFVIAFEALPDFELGEYRGLNIKEYVHSVNDEEIEHEILHQQIDLGKVEEADVIDGDMYIVKVSYKPVESTESTEQPLETQLFLHDHHLYPSLRDKFMNLKVNDSFNYVAAPNDVFPPNIEELVTITQIQKVIPAEANDEFARNASHNESITFDEFKQEVGFKIQEVWDNRSREMLENQIVDEMLKTHDFPCPVSLVSDVAGQMAKDFAQRYKQYTKQDYPELDKLAESYHPDAVQRVKWELIKQSIIEKEGLKVEDYDVDEFAEREAPKYGLDADILRKAIQRSEEMKENILNKKVFDLIIDFAVTEEAPFPGDEAHSHVHENHDDETETDSEN